MMILVSREALAAAIEPNSGPDTWSMMLRPGVSPHLVAKKYGLRYVKAVTFGDSGAPFHLFERPRGSAFSAAAVAQDADVTWNEQQHARQQYKRDDAPASVYRVMDPLYPQQWHLTQVNSARAWARHADYRGSSGVVVSVVDDGLDLEHPDFRQSFVPTLSHDFNGGRGSDVRPYPGDHHGTAAAGVAAAQSNNACGVAACPQCRVAGVKLIAGPASDYQEAEGLTYGHEQVSVYSCSWGPADTGRSMTGPGFMTQRALEQGATRGRGGKGALYVWAGGNGAQERDNGNYDGYANSRWTVAVGAVDHAGRRAYYSEPCACLMVSAPSSGSSGYGITTSSVDYRGQHACTNRFGGTSSAAPLVAGVVGSMLSRHPQLSRRQVVDALARTARQVDQHNPDWTRPNEHGIRHSHEYGWGLVDQDALAQYLEAHARDSMGPELTCGSGQVSLDVALGDGMGEYVWSVDLPGTNCLGDESEIDYVEYVELKLHMHHTARGDVRVTLVDPHGVESRLHEPHDDYSSYSPAGWTYGSARHWGQRMHGIWKVRIADTKHNGRSGRVQSIELVVHGRHDAKRKV